MVLIFKGPPGRNGKPGAPGGMGDAIKKNMMKITEDLARQVSQRKFKQIILFWRHVFRV